MKTVKYVLAATLFFWGINARAQQTEVLLAPAGAPEAVEEVDEDAVVKIGDPVPDFTVRMVDGSTVDIRELRGKVVLVNFWATWCPPCRAEFKRIPKEIVEAFAGEDFVLLPVSREETLETVQKFRRENGYTFPMGLDPDRSVFSLFARNSIPRNYLIDKQGTIVLAEVGYSAEAFEELVDKIRAELEK